MSNLRPSSSFDPSSFSSRDHSTSSIPRRSTSFESRTSEELTTHTRNPQLRTCRSRRDDFEFAMKLSRESGRATRSTRTFGTKDTQTNNRSNTQISLQRQKRISTEIDLPGEDEPGIGVDFQHVNSRCGPRKCLIKHIGDKTPDAHNQPVIWKIPLEV
jgi:hypothetical protein